MLVRNPNDFKSIKIGIAAPERIRFWSYGEVKKPETINYRTFKPERNGLFCEKIFGPVKDWECSCGKYRRVRYRGIVCERCGVEVTHSKVRRERMGHIELATPVVHIWFLKGAPTHVGLMLDIQYKILEKVVYYDAYMITEVDDSIKGQIEVKQIISESEYLELKKKFGNKFKAEMGAKAVRDILQTIDLPKFIKALRKDLVVATGAKYLKLTKRVRVAEAFQDSTNRPEWMVMDCIPVMPPDLRPMVQLEGGRFATSDLNDLYRRVVNRNNRLKRLIDIGAPNMIIRNEKRMLQEAVDVLLDNGKRGRAVTGSNGRPLKSISDIVEGKQGRFRQNLLGKRVDYSGRSVIVVGPTLELHQCGLPKEMAIELFKPFIIRELVKEGHAQNVKSAKRKIENKEVAVYDVLEKVINGHPVLLNRAPTLHRLGIQAFEPILVEGKAIQIHPLVCAAFNADFDGDQMAVHVPLSLEAQAECRLLIMASNNVLSPSNGTPIITPAQDIILGLYCMTIDAQVEDKKIMFFKDSEEALKAYSLGYIKLQSKIIVRYYDEKIETTVGKLIFNNTVNEVIERFGQKRYPYITEKIGKKKLGALLSDWFDVYGSTVTAKLADRIKDLGFHYATITGVSISIQDLVVPNTKEKIIAKADKEQERLEKQLKSGAVSLREMREKSHNLWRAVTAEVTDEMNKQLGEYNNIFIMANSGARGNIDQVRQLAGMRGLMADASGNTVDIPIKSNFREGLSMTEYFISCYGARKGVVDTALRTADSGYLTRRLVDVAQDVMIIEEDCGSKDSIIIKAVKDGYEIVLSLEERVKGRVTAEAIKDPLDNTVIIKKGEIITPSIANQIVAAGYEEIKVRSALTCKSRNGLCRKCYGMDLSSRKLVNIGEAVGIVAAQSIGEPGTQLTMRTFHTGGVDLTKSAGKVEFKAKVDGTIEFDEAVKHTVTTDEDGNKIKIMVRDCRLKLHRAKGNISTYDIPVGAILLVKDGQKVKEGQVIAEHSSAYEYVIAVNEGTIEYHGFSIQTREGEQIAKSDGEAFIHDPKVYRDYIVPKDVEIYVDKNERVRNDEELAMGVTSESAGRVINIISEDDKNIIIRLALGENYPILAGARLYFADGDQIKTDEVIAREAAGLKIGARDIVAGLPRVEELVEARKPKKTALLSEIAGVTEISEKDGMRIVRIISAKQKKEYKVPFGVRLKAFPGKNVEKGEQLTEGSINPHDVISINGKEAAQQFLAEEVQKVYLSQGVATNDRHIETIIRQMSKKVRIREIGDSEYLTDDYIEYEDYKDTNVKLKEAGKAPAVGDEVLLGITKASLNTDSVISAASFQETSSVLTKAAVRGKIDPMHGLKENVIIGKLIPAGTGFDYNDNVVLRATEEGVSLEAAENVLEEEIFKI